MQGAKHNSNRGRGTLGSEVFPGGQAGRQIARIIM